MLRAYNLVILINSLVLAAIFSFTVWAPFLRLLNLELRYRLSPLSKVYIATLHVVRRDPLKPFALMNECTSRNTSLFYIHVFFLKKIKFNLIQFFFFKLFKRVQTSNKFAFLKPIPEIVVSWLPLQQALSSRFGNNHQPNDENETNGHQIGI